MFDVAVSVKAVANVDIGNLQSRSVFWEKARNGNGNASESKFETISKVVKAGVINTIGQFCDDQFLST